MVLITKIIFLLFSIFISCGKPNSTEQNAKVNVTFFDVGQGDAALVTADNQSILIDCGPLHCMLDTQLNIRKLELIDYIILTHEHSDHTGGLNEIIRNKICGKLIFPRGMRILFNHPGIDTISVIMGDTITISPSFFISFLWPAEPIPSADSANEYSLVTLIEWNNTRMLFTGDIGFPQEKRLIDFGLVPHSSILKCPHHGSAGSASWEFLTHINPDFIVTPVGKNNAYNLPSATTIARLTASCKKLFRTDINGNIDIQIYYDGSKNFSYSK